MMASKGVSAIQLSRDLGYQLRTACCMLLRIGEACDDEALRFKLTGTMLTDETHVIGRRRNMSNARREQLAGGSFTMSTVVSARQRDIHVVEAPNRNSSTSGSVGLRLGSVTARFSVMPWLLSAGPASYPANCMRLLY